MDKFQSSLPMILNQTLDSIIPLYRDVFKQHNISEQQWRILRVLWETDRCTTFELSNKTLLPGPSMVGIIDRMMEKGLVSRARSNTDRRKVFVSLTDKGLSLQTELAPKVDKVYQKIVSGCNQQHWETMMATLRTIIESTRDESSRTEQTNVGSEAKVMNG